MKKSLLTTTMLAIVSSLSITGQVAAHHPSADNNPNYDVVDANISDMHNTVIDARIEEAEDDDLMASTARGMDAVDSPTTASGDGSNADQTSSQSAQQVVTAPGNGSTSSTRGNSRR